MKKLKLGLVLVLVLALALVAGPACGGGEEEEEETPTPTPITETPTPGPTEEPGVGSTWEYRVDYDDGRGYTEVDHPYTTTLTEVNVSPPAGICVTPAAVTCNHYEVDSHPDGDCPGATVPKRVAPTTQLQFMGIDMWSNATDKTAVFVKSPICCQAPMLLGLLNVEVSYTDYTAVSGTVGHPYAVGDKWTYTRYEDAEAMGDCLAPATKTFTSEVVAVDVSVTVPAGIFTDCVQIVTAQDGTDNTTTMWWSPTVQSIVKQVDDGIGAIGVETQELSSYNLK